MRQLIEGGTALNPNSGIKSDYTECRPENRTELLAREAAGEIPDEPTYMGVQDYKDLGFKAPDYYDPNEPFGDQYGTFPTWPGLMDRAQSLTFTPVGLRRGGTPVPTLHRQRQPRRPYSGQRGRDRRLRGHRYRLLQGRAEHPATLPESVPAPTRTSSSRRGSASRPARTAGTALPGPACSSSAIYSSGIQGDGHGFGYVDPAELAASGFSATYWARDLKPGIRFISIDTVSEGGVVQESAERQHRRPAVQLARAGAGTGRGQREARRRVRSPPHSQPHLGSPRRGGAALLGQLRRERQLQQPERARARHQPRL